VSAGKRAAYGSRPTLSTGEEVLSAVALQQHKVGQICDGCSKFLLLTEIQVSSA